MSARSRFAPWYRSTQEEQQARAARVAEWANPSDFEFGWSAVEERADLHVGIDWGRGDYSTFAGGEAPPLTFEMLRETMEGLKKRTAEFSQSRGGKLSDQVAVALEAAAQGQRVTFACGSQAAADEVLRRLRAVADELDRIDQALLDRITVAVVPALEPDTIARVIHPTIRDMLGKAFT